VRAGVGRRGEKDEGGLRWVRRRKRRGGGRGQRRVEVEEDEVRRKGTHCR